MLFVSLMGPTAIGDLSDSLDRLRSHPAIVAEIRELIEALRHRIRHVPILYREERPIPLKVHCRYSRDEVMTAFDVRNAKGDLMQPREGVYFHDGSRSNLLFVTLRKSEREYSPSTMYRDYALSADAFHWQSQSTTRPDRERGLRHIEHLERGIVPLLFVRESRKTTHGTTQPYMFLGAVSFEKHEGEQPMNVVWRLEHAIPGDLLRVARVA